MYDMRKFGGTVKYTDTVYTHLQIAKAEFEVIIITASVTVFCYFMRDALQNQMQSSIIEQVGRNIKRKHREKSCEKRLSNALQTTKREAKYK